MLTLKVGVDSDYVFEIPTKPADIIALGERYVAYEERLPLTEQLKAPALADIKAALARLKGGHDRAETSEMNRAASATAYHKAVEVARSLLKEAIEQLEWKYRNNLAMLEKWGLSTKIGARGNVLVEKPDHEADWAKFLIDYVAREQSLPMADRLNTPELAKLIPLAAEVNAQHTTRDTSTSTRQMGIEARANVEGYLLDLLQLACGLLVVTHFGGCVTNELEAWGFPIKAVKPTPKSGGKNEKPIVKS